MSMSMTRLGIGVGQEQEQEPEPEFSPRAGKFKNGRLRQPCKKVAAPHHWAYLAQARVLYDRDQVGGGGLPHLPEPGVPGFLADATYGGQLSQQLQETSVIVLKEEKKTILRQIKETLSQDKYGFLSYELSLQALTIANIFSSVVRESITSGGQIRWNFQDVIFRYLFQDTVMVFSIQFI